MANPPSPTPNADEDYYLAPHHQRPFNAGIKRKRIDFVPASDTTTTTTTTALPTPSSTAGSRYLSIVLSSQQPTPTHPAAPPDPTPTCPVCKKPITEESRVEHESSIAHQVCLEHSHPPSHLDRSRKGLKYLEGFGWDPDSRVGLGARSDGIRVPVKAVEKRDRGGVGLGMGDGEEEEEVVVGKRRVTRDERREGGSLNAKEVRRLDEEKRIKAEKLRSVFYGEDLSRYLGPDG